MEPRLGALHDTSPALVFQRRLFVKHCQNPINKVQLPPKLKYDIKQPMQIHTAHYPIWALTQLEGDNGEKQGSRSELRLLEGGNKRVMQISIITNVVYTEFHTCLF